ncbi:MetQ/NlpA family ABC transporter substrate-binding protein [Paenibacillus sp. CMAA1364]
MKKWAIAVLSLSLLVVLSACGSKSSNALKIGASSIPHAEILKHIQPALEKEGVKLEIIEFTDYVQPNTQLFEKQLDANFFQHQPFLDSENEKRKMDLVSIVGVHIEPLGGYSSRIKSIDELADGAKVAIPNDPTNGGRALNLLADNGLITLNESNKVEAKISDITDNPKNLKITESEAAILPRQLEEVDLAIINTNYVLEAGLDPVKDALIIEGKDNPNVNILVARPDNKDSEAIQKLKKALTSEDTKKFIEDEYKGAVVPAF